MTDTGADLSKNDLFKLKNALFHGMNTVKETAFFRNHQAEIERDLPIAEQFTLDFLRNYLRPFTPEETNPLLQKLDVTSDKDLNLMKIMNDALTLAGIHKLADVIRTSTISGYATSEGKRTNLTNDVMFLGFEIQAGENNSQTTTTSQSELMDKVNAQEAAQDFQEPNLKYVISQKGRIYRNQEFDRVDPLGNLVSDEISHSNDDLEKPELEHTEGEEEGSPRGTIRLQVCWDLQHSLPVYIHFEAGSEKEVMELRLRFYFESNVEGVTQFPLVLKRNDKNTFTTRMNEAGNELVTEEVEYLEEDLYSKRKERLVNIGNVQLKEQLLTVWANNSHWNSLEYFDSEGHSLGDWD